MKEQLRRAWQRANDPKVIAAAALIVSLLVPGAAAPSLQACFSLIAQVAMATQERSNGK